MYVYAPADLPAGAPLVVALHGCTQTVRDYEHAGWNEVADREGFAVVYAETSRTNNAGGCFNWYLQGDTERDRGEALSIRQMVDHTVAAFRSDRSRIYVTGLSAGGAMTAVMLAAYPDRFAGGGVIAGIPYHCATRPQEAMVCTGGANRKPEAWGDAVRSALADRGVDPADVPWPRVSIWHGTDDARVRTRASEELVEQWTNLHGADLEPDDTTPPAGSTRRNHRYRAYHDERDTPVVEYHIIEGMGHGTPVDPGSGRRQCGSTAPYMLDVDICSSYEIARFWGIVREE